MTYLKCRQRKEKVNKPEKDVNKIVNIIKRGGVVIFPTDTVYGIGVLPEKKPVERLYEIKKRDPSKKMIALIDNLDTVREIVDETQENMKRIGKVLDTFWPGELTVIFKADKKFTEKFDENMDTIGVRIPENKTALKIIKAAGGIVLTTSANISGEEAVKKFEDINEKLLSNVDGVVKDTSVLTGVPSTIIKYEKGKITLLRKGNIEIEKIKKLMKG